MSYEGKKSCVEGGLVRRPYDTSGTLGFPLEMGNLTQEARLVQRVKQVVLLPENENLPTGVDGFGKVTEFRISASPLSAPQRAGSVHR